MKVVVVHNPKSGSAVSARRLRPMFRRHGITVTAFIKTSTSLAHDLQPFLTRKDCVVAVIGGDGTISSVATLATGSHAVLAPLPGGTLNHFTKDLGIPQELEKAIAKLATSSVRTIDVARVNDVIFLNNSSIGLYPSSLQTRQRIESRFGKWVSAVIGIVRALLRHETYELRIDGRHVATPFVFVGNNEYDFSNPGSGRAHLNRGLLSIYVVTGARRIELWTLLWHALRGTLARHESFQSYTATEITITSTRRTLHVSHDGELSRLELPLHYEILPGALRVIGSS